MEALALFDFDGTLIRGDSIVPYLCRAHAQGDASLGDLMAAATGYFLFRLHLRTAEEATTRALQFRRRLLSPPGKRRKICCLQDSFPLLRRLVQAMRHKS